MLARDFSHTVHSIIRRAHKLRAETLRGRVLFGRNTAKREQLRTRTPACARRGQGSLAQANVERGKRARANVERGQSARHCSVANANMERRAPGPGTLATSNPEIQAIGSWARYLGLGTQA